MNRETLRLNEGEVAVVGYGSLFSAPSVSTTLGREYDGPFLIGHVAGWRRRWNAAMPNQAFYYERSGERVYPERIVYLNVERERGALMNCVVFVIRKDELAAMDSREWIYDRTVVTNDLRDVIVQGGDAVMYVAREDCISPNTTSPREAAIRASYVRILDTALASLPADVRAAYERSTDAIPRELLIDDRLDPDRENPWAAAGKRHSPEAHLEG